MKYDNGQEIVDFLSIDNELLTKVYRARNLTKTQKDVLLSICKQVFFQEVSGVVRTDWWGTVSITAQDVGCSERTVRRVYSELEKRNIIKTRKELRQSTDKKGNVIYRKAFRITINTHINGWIC